MVKTSKFRPPNNCQDDVSLLECSKPKNTQYKDRGLLMFSETGKLRARKKILYSNQGVFKDVHPVQRLEDKVCSKFMEFFYSSLWLLFSDKKRRKKGSCLYENQEVLVKKKPLKIYLDKSQVIKTIPILTLSASHECQYKSFRNKLNHLHRTKKKLTWLANQTLRTRGESSMRQ